MEKKYKLIFIAFAFFVAWLVPLQWVTAGDEDMMSPYTQFDPETGFFIPIDPQTVDPMTQGHEPSSSTTSSTAQVPAPQAMDEEISTTSPDSQGHILLISGVVLLLLVGTVFYIRRAKIKSASDVTP